MEAEHECDNCGLKFIAEEMNEIKDLNLRLTPGGIVPSGECPECGCLCYPVDVLEKLEPYKFPSWDTLRSYEVIFYPNHLTVVTDCNEIYFEHYVDEWSAQHNSSGVTIEEYLRNHGHFAVTGESTDIKITIA